MFTTTITAKITSLFVVSVFSLANVTLVGDTLPEDNAIPNSTSSLMSNQHPESKETSTFSVEQEQMLLEREARSASRSAIRTEAPFKVANAEWGIDTSAVKVVPSGSTVFHKDLEEFVPKLNKQERKIHNNLVEKSEEKKRKKAASKKAAKVAKKESKKEAKEEAAAPAVAPTAAPAQSSAASPKTKSPTAAVASGGSKHAQIVSIANSLTGTPYLYGGTNPGSGLDCSGFTSYVYAQVGINLPRSSGAQKGSGRVISRAEAIPGDLIWSPGHVAIYLGGNTQIDAPRPGKSIQPRQIWQSNPTFLRAA